MARYDQNQAECLIFTYKEGLLSAVAHDLKLKVGEFSIDIDTDAGTISAQFEVASIQVVHAQRDGADAPRVLSADDKGKIIKNMQKDVLKVRRNKQITFEATDVEFDDDKFEIEGDLKIEGRTRQVRIPVVREGDTYSVSFRFNQKDFGIRPFSAMMGTIKVKPHVEVRLTLPA